MRGDGSGSNRLRLGVIIDRDPLFEPWEVRLFETLARLETVDLAFVVVLPHAAPTPAESRWLKRFLGWESRLLKTPLRPRYDLSFTSLKDLKPYGPGARRHRKADILLNHARQSLPEDHRFREKEIWGYSVFLPGQSPDAQAIAPVITDAPFTEVSIGRIGPGGKHTPIARARTNTKPVATYNGAFASDVLPQLLMRELAAFRLGLAHATPDCADTGRIAATGRDRTHQDRFAAPLPYAMHMTGRASKAAFARARGALDRRANQWSLMVGRGDPLTNSMGALVELDQPAGESRAHPFLFVKDGVTWVFYQAFGPAHPQGKLHVGRLDGDRLFDVQALNFGPIHAAFPYIFAHDGEVFMVPETHQRDQVEVWRCLEFPGQWVLHASALEGQAPADSVLFEHGSAWWLFTSHASGDMPDYCRELHVYQASGPDLSELTPHALNPAVMDTTCARMGGRPFVRNGTLYRPGQNSSHGLLGFGLSIMAIDTLTLTDYREHRVRSINAVRRKGTIGCHHLDVAPGQFIIDARRTTARRGLGRRPITLHAR
ncbi:MAG: hypothetical protein AAFR94_03845 [Pseudomonadota bacterium]